MMNRCAFGCEGSGGLRRLNLAVSSLSSYLDGCESTCLAWKHVPQRLHNVCVLLWRLPKDEVPFA